MGSPSVMFSMLMLRDNLAMNIWLIMETSSVMRFNFPASLPTADAMCEQAS